MSLITKLSLRRNHLCLRGVCVCYYKITRNVRYGKGKACFACEKISFFIISLTVLFSPHCSSLKSAHLFHALDGAQFLHEKFHSGGVFHHYHDVAGE